MDNESWCASCVTSTTDYIHLLGSSGGSVNNYQQLNESEKKDYNNEALYTGFTVNSFVAYKQFISSHGSLYFIIANNGDLF